MKNCGSSQERSIPKEAKESITEEVGLERGEKIFQIERNV